MLVEPNWGAFRAKFNGKEQASFEWFSYLLFCQEHGLPKGIFRFFNQTGIETDPIVVADKTIGWQAKYIMGKLSSYEGVLSKALRDAKNENPDLNCVYFYLNKDFTSSSQKGQKSPVYKQNIEKQAEALDIQVIWKTASYFESIFVCQESAHISGHFFSLKSKLEELYEELERHTQAIFRPIRTAIQFQGMTIELERNQEMAEVREAVDSNAVVVITGDAGVGKSALAKRLAEQLGDDSFLFTLKATEFNVANVNEVLGKYGGFNLAELEGLTANVGLRILVIDSAERLGDLEDPQSFHEFLTSMIENRWRIVLTSRYGYLQDLTYMIFEDHQSPYKIVNVQGISATELSRLAENFGFELPGEVRLRKLLRIPFYLSMYLDHFAGEKMRPRYGEFKNAVWDKQIARSSFIKDQMHLRRAECFIEIAKHRAETGQLFMLMSEFQEPISRLVDDEIIRFDEKVGGYFITHDVYEEWGLERHINRLSVSASNPAEFFCELGDSLAMRRAFRTWIQESQVSDATVLTMLQAAFESDEIDDHWRDECTVSILLSSDVSLLVRHLDQERTELPIEASDKPWEQPTLPALERSLFLLRLACKEVDQSLLQSVYGDHDVDIPDVFTRPCGHGWEVLISYIYQHRRQFGFANLTLILDVLEDYTQKHRRGSGTRDAGLLALHYFGYLSQDQHWYGDDYTRVAKVMANSAHEISTELERMLLAYADVPRSEQPEVFRAFSQVVLGSILDNSVVAEAIPNSVIEHAKQEWRSRRDPNDPIGIRDYDIEPMFNIAKDYQRYYPSSAYQTPVLKLLHVSPFETVKFIVEFTNQCVEHLSTSEFGQELIEIHIPIRDGQPPAIQYISNRLWNIYRGTQVSALESWLLEQSKQATPDVLRDWCTYLLEASRSTSITAIVVSVVLAEPDKLFDIAQILFRTKELFEYDFVRHQLDLTAESHYRMVHDPKGIFMRERVATCEQAHRQTTLENLALNYQLLRREGIDEVEFEIRRERIYEILDQHYAELEESTAEAESAVNWRMSLARMDLRKMKVQMSNVEEGVQLSFESELQPDLAQYRDSRQEVLDHEMEHLPFANWARSRWQKDSEKALDSKYDQDPASVLSKVEEIETLLLTADDDAFPFRLMLGATPSYATAVLVRDHRHNLTETQWQFCAKRIQDFAALPLLQTTEFQIGDGYEPAVNSLPIVYEHLTAKREDILGLFLCLLLNDHPVTAADTIGGNFAGILADSALWQESQDVMIRLIKAYLIYKPKLIEIREKLYRENLENKVRANHFSDVLNQLFEEFGDAIESALMGSIQLVSPQLGGVDGVTLLSALRMLPNELPSDDVTDLATGLTYQIVNQLIDREKRRSELSIRASHFYPKVAAILLHLNEEQRQSYISPFLDNLDKLEDRSSLFDELILYEDRVQRVDQFWSVWGLFYEKMVEMSNGQRRSSDGLIHSYLFAWPYWSDTAKSWHTLRRSDDAFFSRVVEEFGNSKAVLYSLAKMLNEVGHDHLEEGVSWLARCIEKAGHEPELETNTLYYLEIIARRLRRQSRHVIKTNVSFRQKVLVILNFLVNKGSVAGYRLREDLL